MIIKKYGIELHKLTEKDIELVRIQRNKESIRSRMIDQRIITIEEQKEWFDSINNANNFYFIIHYEGKKIGLAHSKNIDWEKKEDEGGIFVWDENYWNTGAAIKASIVMMQLCFEIIELERTFAQVHKNNKFAKDLNLSLGYIKTINNQMVLNKANYQNKIKRLRWLASLGTDSKPLLLTDITVTNSELESYRQKKYPNNILNKLTYLKLINS